MKKQNNVTTKTDKYNLAQKAMFGVALKDYADLWSANNPELNKDGYTDVAGLNRAALYKAYKGDVTDANVELVANNISQSVDSMIAFDMKKMWKHFKIRVKEEKKFGYEMISLFFVIYFMVLFLLNSNLMNMLLLVVSLVSVVHNASNLWRIKFKKTEKDIKLIRALDIIGIIAFVVVLVLGVLCQL